MSRHSQSVLGHGLFPWFGKSPTLSAGILLLPVAADIKRVTEIFLCQSLRLSITTQDFFPFTGGYAIEDEAELEPPFAVVAVTIAEKILAQEGTWQCMGTVQFITYSSETSTPDHAQIVRAIYAALANLSPDSSSPDFSFHGIDITGQSVTQDEELKAHADVIQFTCGTGG